MKMPMWPDMVLVGRVARVHGLRGQIVVNPETDFPDARFRIGSVVYRVAADGGPEPLKIAAVRFHRGRPIVGFEGVESIDQAEALTGAELRVPVASLERLPAGAFYHHDLAGCRVQTQSGEVVGEVDRVEGGSGVSQLVITTGRGDEVLVPLATDICVTIDVGRKLIVIEPPEGLLELNQKRAQGPGLKVQGARRRRR
jgi:16S rRNA processing protein RimM